jgi:glycosyltransferase involved in cell wall biosynthesis
MGDFLQTEETRAARRPFRIGIVSLSAIPDDPRVRRQGDLFAARGWDVHGFGLPGALSQAPDWSHSALASADIDDQPAPRGGRGDSVATAPAGSSHAAGFRRSRVARRLRKYRHMSRALIDRRHAAEAYWAFDPRFSALHGLAQSWRADIWLANDWTALPIARRLAQEQGVPYAYDTHELAIEEFAHQWRWRLLQRPLIAAIEGEGIAGASVVSCVSQGIADRLEMFHGLQTKPLVIRNMPHYQLHHPQARPADVVRVLYHGVVSPGRGLEACIDSVAMWPAQFTLTIRGPAAPSYRASLLERARAAGVDQRVELASAVPMTELVREAAQFDIGLFALPGHSEQNVYVLPNKFFEYTMAGLALCVSDLPEMASLLRQHDLGCLISEVTPAAVAEAIHGCHQAGVEGYKARALEAAKILNWEMEAGRLFAAIEQAAIKATEPRPTPRER